MDTAMVTGPSPDRRAAPNRSHHQCRTRWLPLVSGPCWPRRRDGNCTPNSKNSVVDDRGRGDAVQREPPDLAVGAVEALEQPTTHVQWPDDAAARDAVCPRHRTWALAT